MTTSDYREAQSNVALVASELEPDFLFGIRGYLATVGVEHQTGLDFEIEARANGKKYSLSDHMHGLIYALLTNQTKWDSIEPHLPEIDRIFFYYDIEKLKETAPCYFEESIKAIKCGNRQIKAQMDALHSNIEMLETIQTDFGSVDKFLTSAPAYEIVQQLSSGDSKYKLKQVGEALAWEYIRNMGIDGAKPDVHMRRFLGKSRLGASTIDPASIEDVLAAVDILSQQSGLSKAEIDHLIWSYCASGKGEVCTAEPHCSKCVIKYYCNNDTGKPRA